MTRARSSHQRARGFTLLELLLAVAVFAVVLVAIHGVFYGGLRLRNTTVRALEAAVPLEQALAIMKRDLLNIVMPGGTLFGQFQTTPTTNTVTGQLGQSAGTPGVGAISQGFATPSFHTAAGIIDDTAPWGEVEKVFYYLAEPTNNTPGKDLYRSVTRNLLPTLQEQSEAQWLLSGVQSLFFLYYDGTQWAQTWDSTTASSKLPEALKVEIYLTRDATNQTYPAPVELVVPLVVRASTNQTTQSSTDENAPTEGGSS